MLWLKVTKRAQMGQILESRFPKMIQMGSLKAQTLEKEEGWNRGNREKFGIMAFWQKA